MGMLLLWPLGQFIVGLKPGKKIRTFKIHGLKAMASPVAQGNFGPIQNRFY
jgi:hypothetical protein